MANALYDNARYLFATAQLDWESSGKIKCLLVDTNVYTPVLTGTPQLADIGASARGTALMAISNPVVDANGACDGDNVTFSTVAPPNGQANAYLEAIVIYYEGVDEAHSPLIAYIDQATGLPITPNTGDIIITWDNGTNKIFRL